MASRGRQSAASLSVARVGVDNRLAPPKTLTPAQKAVWVRMINSRPADWFSEENAGMLIQYCRHEVQSNLIAAELENFKPEWLTEDEGLKRFKTLSQMQEVETRAMSSLLTKLRCTPQSMYDAKKANTKAGKSGRKPWQGDQ